MSDLPEKMTLYPSRLRLIVMSMIYCGFSAVFIFAAPTIGLWGWFFAVILIVAAVYDLRQLFMKDSFLILEMTHFEESLYGQTSRYAWDEVSAFTMQRGIKGSAHVVAQRITDTASSDLDELTVETVMIVNPFSISTRKLLTLLNGFRYRALARNGAE